MEADGDGQTDIESLDRDISKAEVYETIRMLKNGKAAGPDGMISEFLKNSACSVVPFLVRYLNKLFSSGSYPDNWSEAVIQPLHKKATRIYLTTIEACPCWTSVANCTVILLTKG